MPTVLTANEIRVIGCLLEKAITTPDQYPLSLNALTNACNQKSNRDPVLDLEERIVQETVDALVRKHLVLERSGFGSRVSKYQQRFCNTGFGSLEFNPVQTAILCELMLRGPQSAGELRGRIGRMCDVTDSAQVEGELEKLAQRADGPFIVKLAREAGWRDARSQPLTFTQTFLLFSRSRSSLRGRCSRPCDASTLPMWSTITGTGERFSAEAMPAISELSMWICR